MERREQMGKLRQRLLDAQAESAVAKMREITSGSLPHQAALGLSDLWSAEPGRYGRG